MTAPSLLGGEGMGTLGMRALSAEIELALRPWPQDLELDHTASAHASSIFATRGRHIAELRLGFAIARTAVVREPLR